MKSRDTNPSVAAVDVTPEPRSAGEAEEVGQAIGEAFDNGQRGHLPIAVAEGDFSTPVQRTRTITRPRGLRTLESQVATPELQRAPEPIAAALSTEELVRHEASVVDEFLAAPPTPVPEVQETPLPEQTKSPASAWGFTPAADGMAEALAGRPDLAAFPETQGSLPTVEEIDVFADVRVEDSEPQSPDHLLAPAAAEMFGATPTEQSPEVVTAPTPTDVFAASFVDAPAADPEPDVEVGPLPPSPAESELSPLAQTLANMAESMHGEVALDATIDLDIADGPLLPLPIEPTGESSSRAPAPRLTPPPIPTGAAPDAASSAGRTAGATAPPIAPVPDAPGLATSLTRLPEALVERPRRPKRSKPWYEEVFDESYLRTLPFMTAEQTLHEVDFIESSLGLPRGSEVLDVGCGYGRHAIELVQRGLSVTGVDLSLPLLIRAADESQRRSVAVNFVHTDMREMSFERQFSGAYCMLTSFGYFDDDSNLKVAEGIARSLKPGGRFLIDVLNRDYVVGDLPARVWWEGDGCVVLEEVDFNFNTNRVLTHRSVVFEDGQQLEQEISVRVYSLHELGKLLRQAGFRIIEVSGSIPTRGHFFGSHSRNLLILAERRSE